MVVYAIILAIFAFCTITGQIGVTEINRNILFKKKTFGVPIARKRLLKIQAIIPSLIQSALDDKCIIETFSSDIGETRYLITAKGQKL